MTSRVAGTSSSPLAPRLHVARNEGSLANRHEGRQYVFCGLTPGACPTPALTTPSDGNARHGSAIYTTKAHVARAVNPVSRKRPLLRSLQAPQTDSRVRQ